MATATLRKSRVTKLGLAAVLSLGMVGALAPTAFAQDSNTDTTNNPPAEGRPHPRLTDAQKACLQQHGEVKPAEGTRPTDAQRAAHRAAAKACGITLPARPGRHRPRLTAAQQTCLEEHGVTKPTPPANGERPARPTAAQRAAFRAAAQDCGIKVPDKPPAGDGNGNANDNTNGNNDSSNSSSTST
jgi:hypothetical protein